MADPRILLTFAGSLDFQCKRTTVGDVMALYNVATRLVQQGLQPSIAWGGNLFELDPLRVDIRAVPPDSVDCLVFVCGPLAEFINVICDRFGRARKVAVGVSLIEELGTEKLFDAVVPRDSAGMSTFDLAVADVGWPHFRIDQRHQAPGVGVCLVGRQAEYFAADKSNTIAVMIDKVRSEYRLPAAELNTLIYPARPNIYCAEMELQSRQILVTTRMHATLLSVFHRIPVISIDQIAGGAKVTRLNAKVGVDTIQVSDAMPGQFLETLRSAISTRGESVRPSAAQQQKLIELSRDALETSIGTIMNYV